MRHRPALLAALSLAAAAALARPAAAAPGSTSDTVRAALSRGYGATCGLDNKPVSAGGYWPCIDIGPYRFVQGYGAMTAFVVLRDAAPFPIYRSDDRGEEFLVSGEWTRDLARRVSAWWSDEVEGGRERRERDDASSARLRDAEREVLRYAPRGAEPESAAPGPAGGVAPVTGPQPRAEAAPGLEPLPPGPAAAVPPPGGRELAPGVIQLPSGAPYRR